VVTKVNQNDRELLETMDSLLKTISNITVTDIDRTFFLMQLGIEGGRPHTQEELAEKYGVSVELVRFSYQKVIAKTRNDIKERLAPLRHKDNDAQKGLSSVESKEVIETVRKLTPELIKYLGSHEHDLEKIRWQVFEHLVAEFFASWGFEDVALVGRNSNTSADIFAAYRISAIGERVCYFVEVKRWKKRVGVEMIDRVYGAMLFERPKYGWHAAMIVSVVGFKDFNKYTREELTRKGLLLRDREDLLRWLKDYKPNKDGLWLPSPSNKLTI
jgi:hypothetical protein